ncbi:hypothetical protein GCM10028796_56070 [Ramlibacter monticola]|uniref:Uncharacterized protein n=1 Tax=Ramlibacter monticola TaxID=1926872 RepID=A0A937CXR6_9BURK|nr:hypothetical protein [Ramlibacter monticola]MBL0395149.1 hypothetical protein [Ramlibacter monticola]
MNEDPIPGRALPLRQWTPEHWFGAAVVLIIFLGLGLAIWPGWNRIAHLFG